jgi:L-lactate dehydrogenase (cytochrome)
MLPRIRDAVGDGFPLIFDSGVRQGEDIVRALASGADFVMLGRPVLFAIGAEQETGLTAFFTLLSKELDIALAQLGLSDVRQIDHLALAAWHRVSRDAAAPEPEDFDHRSATLA